MTDAEILGAIKRYVDDAVVFVTEAAERGDAVIGQGVLTLASALTKVHEIVIDVEDGLTAVAASARITQKTVAASRSRSRPGPPAQLGELVLRVESNTRPVVRQIERDDAGNLTRIVETPAD